MLSPLPPISVFLTLLAYASALSPQHRPRSGRPHSGLVARVPEHEPRADTHPVLNVHPTKQPLRKRSGACKISIASASLSSSSALASSASQQGASSRVSSASVATSSANGLVQAHAVAPSSSLALSSSTKASSIASAFGKPSSSSATFTSKTMGGGGAQLSNNKQSTSQTSTNPAPTHTTQASSSKGPGTTTQSSFQVSSSKASSSQTSSTQIASTQSTSTKASSTQVSTQTSSSSVVSSSSTTTTASTATTTVYIDDAIASELTSWPTVTQASATPSVTASTTADPYVLSLSYALNNADNTLFTEERMTGDLTYYATGQTSCGAVYDDTTFTAAVSHLLYDTWPGATTNTNRNPICGPFVPGRLSLTSEVLVASTLGSALIGGDGLLNCVSGDMCHLPLTATLTYEGKSARVQIVDRCEGCAIDDIDVTPAVFEYLTGDLALGRIYGTKTSFTWSFDTN